MSEIDNFKDDDYLFLMNSYPSPIVFDSEIYPTLEHAFQAAKTDDFYDRESIRLASSARAAKRIGRSIVIRLGWDNLRVNVMRELLTIKFEDPDLAKKLLQTGKAELISGGDTFWGVVNGQGENNLGKLLMEVRESLVKEIVEDLKDSSREFLTKLGWQRETQGDSLFNECWVQSHNPDCFFDLESALVHQLKQTVSLLS